MAIESFELSSPLLEQALGQIVAEQPYRAQVFQKHKVDYVTRRAQSLRAMAVSEQLDPISLMQELKEADEKAKNQPDRDWYLANTKLLVNRIEMSFHNHFGEQFRRLLILINNAEPAGLPDYLNLWRIRDAVFGWGAAVQLHIVTYKEMLLPVYQVMQDSVHLVNQDAGSIAHVTDLVENTTTAANTQFEELRQLTHDFEIPPQAHHSYKLLIEAVRALGRDFCAHSQQEHDFLFPALKGTQSFAASHDQAEVFRPADPEGDPLLNYIHAWTGDHPRRTGWGRQAMMGFAFLLLAAVLAGYALYPVVTSLVEAYRAEDEARLSQEIQLQQAVQNKAPGIIYPLVEKFCQGWTRYQYLRK